MRHMDSVPFPSVSLPACVFSFPIPISQGIKFISREPEKREGEKQEWEKWEQGVKDHDQHDQRADSGLDMLLLLIILDDCTLKILAEK